ncbi:MAG: hypothetical protein ACRCUJ_03865 [Phocaeicola sp.]
MNIIKIVLKHFILFISWLLFSPFYFWLSKIISKQSVYVRSIWTVLSPFALVLLFFYFRFEEMARYTSRSGIDRITEAELPFKYIYDIDGFLNLSLSDHTTTYHAYFMYTPSELAYTKLDSLCSVEQTNWSKTVTENKEIYFYSRVWGNGMQAPKGENEQEDRFLKISLVRGSKSVVIKIGSW